MNNSLRRSGARFLFLCLLRAIKRDIFSEMYYSVCVCVPFMLLSCVNQHCTQTCIHTYYLLERVTCSIVSYHFICSSASALHTHTHTGKHTQSESHTCMHAWEERPLVKCGVLIRAATQASLEVQDAILLRLLV